LAGVVHRHYDPKTEGYGSFDEWLRAADALSGAKGLPVGAKPKGTGRNADLEELGLAAMPATLEALKRGFRNAIFAAHPDHGGTDAAAIAVMAAYKRLLNLF